MGTVADHVEFNNRYLSLADLYPPDRYGGSERVIHELTNALIDTGFISGIMAGGSEKREPSRDCHLPIWRFHVTPAPLPVLLMGIYDHYRRLPQLPVREDGTVLVHHRFSGWAAQRTGHLKNRSSISFFYGPIDEEWITQWKGSQKSTPKSIASPLLRTMLPPLLKSIQRTALKSSNAVVTLGDYTKNQIENLLDHEYPPVSVIRPGVDHSVFYPPRDKRAAKEAVGLNPEKIVLLSVRRLVPRMGIEDLLESLAILAGDDPSIHLIVVGSGIMKQWLEKEIHRRSLSDSVTIQGFVDEKSLPDFYRAADLFLLPSIDLEGFGLVTLESLACGVPVVATTVGETIHLLGNAGEISRLVPPGEPMNLARASKELLPVSRETSARCVEFSQNFTWEAMAQAVTSLADSLR